MTKKKLTLKHLIDQKEQLIRDLKGKKTQDLHIEQLDSTITIEEPDVALVSESIELAQDENYEGTGDEYLVYNIVKDPDLKDRELHKIYGCAEPSDIVKKLFDPGTIQGIAQAGMTLAGFGS